VKEERNRTLFSEISIDLKLEQDRAARERQDEVGFAAEAKELRLGQPWIT
jgi:hypothetical protein